ncbi:PRC-barrel domain-containing protein [Dactylosporangium matsuzakiense]|uniref:Photosystem reaction center subunit H n=2 Tax=Dactylosporangium matsuzakiense TaxID=53360 RepID=A0A9W6KFQ6_9ACTN|nr:PRC-barrel domain-containing protein [Dactylosporangium matsuzakiense]UWZ42245.1 PRC-barrel domain-containing protein [Dactylosporangium matsuzakiense]GLK99898.1 photosystem reaction center subunit H [Dactylosporangium matsuzakiense]
MAVVTIDGDDIADIKDIVFDGETGRVRGFTLNGRGLFAGPLHKALPAESVRAVGRDAVMIDDAALTVGLEAVVPAARIGDSDVLGDHVLTEGGTDLGTVADVILEVRDGVVDLVGYEIVASAALHSDGRRVLLPLPRTVATSGEAVIVPTDVVQFLRQDLPGFGNAVAAFRHREHDAEEGGGDVAQ